MDVCEKEQTKRSPLGPSKKNNAVSHKPRTREITSRYKTAIPSPSLSTPKRSPSPNFTRTALTPSPSVSKRAQSAERRRHITSSSPPRPSATLHNSSRQLMGGGTPEGLWPSTRSYYVSFQSDAFFLPINKKERSVTNISSDQNLKPSSNVAHRQAESPAIQRKVTPERKKTPSRGKNASDQSKNSRPVENSHARVIDQHMWSNRKDGKMCSNASTKSMDLTEESIRADALPIPGRGVSPIRRMSSSDHVGRGLHRSVVARRVSFDGIGRVGYEANSVDDSSPRLSEPSKLVSSASDHVGSGIHKSVSEVTRRVSFDGIGRVGYEVDSIDDSSLRQSGSSKLVASGLGVSLSSLERASSATRPSRSLSSPLSSPSKATLASSSPSRTMLSPSRARPSNPCHSASSVTSRPNNSTSVLSFVSDFWKGKKGVNRLEDAHQLRLLYNRYLQWRFVNARVDTALSIQKVTAENILCNVWSITSKLRDSVTMKRINLQHLSQDMKLSSVLKEQMICLDDWALVEREHSSSLSGAIEALEASTLRLPITGGARAELHAVKDAISSAVDVMQAMGSSICSLLSRVEGMNSLVSELAEVAAQERAMLDECRDLLASTAVIQVEESSLITHFIQMKQGIHKMEQPISAIESLV
ncbi:AUGMIN subunit 8-like [Tasmannia lanceolata]|uniref:AUGMIN subunit 8-like n=1 Tax=Tasmannia lanceolata TaxID=3420 RepID=UPI0040645C2F